MPTSIGLKEVHSHILDNNDTLEKIDERKNRKAALKKIGAQATYTETNKMAKKNIGADKRAYLDGLAARQRKLLATEVHHCNSYSL